MDFSLGSRRSRHVRLGVAPSSACLGSRVEGGRLEAATGSVPTWDSAPGQPS